MKKKKQSSSHHGAKPAIQLMSSAGLLQLLIRSIADYKARAIKKTERPVRMAIKELLIRLGHTTEEAKEITKIIMEQTQ